jgi:hypothetical protein
LAFKFAELNPASSISARKSNFNFFIIQVLNVRCRTFHLFPSDFYASE